MNKADLKERAYCLSAPNKVHYWDVVSKVETCRFCRESRPWDIDGTPVAMRTSGRKVRSPESKRMREQIMALEVEESQVIDHSHLVCRLYPNGSIERCGLGSTLKSLRQETRRERNWDCDHHGVPKYATVTRVK